MNITKKDFEKVSEEIKKEAVKTSMEQLRKKMKEAIETVRKRKINGTYVTEAISNACEAGIDTVDKLIDQIYEECGIE